MSKVYLVSGLGIGTYENDWAAAAVFATYEAAAARIAKWREDDITYGGYEVRYKIEDFEVENS